MDLKLNDYRNVCEELGLCLALSCCDNYYYTISKNCPSWLIHFLGSDERCGLIEMSTEWKCIDGEFLPDTPKRLMENISKEQLKQELSDMLIKLKKAIVQKKKNDIEQDFWEHTYTITGTY